jgi:adenosine deaminase
LLAAETFGLARQQILRLCQNAIRAAFLSEEEKLDLLSKMPEDPLRDKEPPVATAKQPVLPANCRDSSSSRSDRDSSG